MLSSKGILENITELPQLMIMASTGSLTGKESVWTDLSSIEFGSPQKLTRLNQDELAARRVVYHTLNPALAETSQAKTSLYKKYSSVRPCPYARVTASWYAENGCIDLA